MAPESSSAERNTPDLSLYGFGSRVVHHTKGRLSYYHPSCHMMDYIVHSMNMTLCDSFYFKLANPEYHPYILRLYCGVLFWTQCLRAGNDAKALTDVQHQFLNRFLDNHPLETLSIPGPLIVLFRTLCSSQPEFPHYGKVYPRIPALPGPARRDAFMRNLPESYFLPNVSGIFALLEDLNRLLSQDPPVYPKRGKHIPVTENAVCTFGHKTFSPHAYRTEDEIWSLVSPGLQYPCEADQKLNEAFAERYSDFDFHVTAAANNLENISSFLHMKRNMVWFTQVKGVANAVAASFEGSGTLADCSPHGMVANQVMVCLSNPEHLPEPPTCTADKRAIYEFLRKLLLPSLRRISGCFPTILSSGRSDRKLVIMAHSGKEGPSALALKITAPTSPSHRWSGEHSNPKAQPRRCRCRNRYSELTFNFLLVVSQGLGNATKDNASRLS